MAAKSKKLKAVRFKEHLVWEPLDKYAHFFALVIILGGFFLAVKGTLEGDNYFIQIIGGLFTLVGFTLTRLFKLIIVDEKRG
jgi:hypothetical protein